MKSRKLKNLHLKNSIAIKVCIFTAKVIPYSLGQKVFSKCYSESLMTPSDWNSGNCSIEFSQQTTVKVFSREFCEIFKNPLFTKHLRQHDSFWIFSFTWLFLPPSKLIETSFFLFLNMFYHVFRTWWISWSLHLENFTLQNKQPSCCCMTTTWWKHAFLQDITCSSSLKSHKQPPELFYRKSCS